MTDITDLISKQYIFIDKHYRNSHELFEDIGKKLHQDGFVKDSYVEALKLREKLFPTGLETPFINVAIPHTEAKHVLKPLISIIRLDEPIPFEVMGGQEGQFIDIKLIILLAIHDPHSHLDVLQQLIFMLSTPEMTQLLDAQTADDIHRCVINLIEKR